MTIYHEKNTDFILKSLILTAKDGRYTSIAPVAWIDICVILSIMVSSQQEIRISVLAHLAGLEDEYSISPETLGNFIIP